MRVLAIFCAAFASGVALAQYLLPTKWALILCAIFASAALIMGLCGCAAKRGAWAKCAFLCALGLALAHFVKCFPDEIFIQHFSVQVFVLLHFEIFFFYPLHAAGATALLRALYQVNFHSPNQ